MNLFSKIVIPVFIVFVVFYGFKKKINIYESFLEGAKIIFRRCKGRFNNIF